MYEMEGITAWVTENGEYHRGEAFMMDKDRKGQTGTERQDTESVRDSAGQQD